MRGIGAVSRLLLIVCLVIFNRFLYVEGQSDDEQVQQQIEQYKQLISNSETSGDKTASAKYITKLGYLYWQIDAPSEAIKYFQKSIQLNIELGNKNAEHVLYSNLGLIYTAQEEYDKAISSFEKSLDINKQMGNKEDMASDYLNIALALEQQGYYAEAINKASLALQKGLEINNLDIAKSCYGVLGECNEKLGHTKEASANYEKYNALTKQLQKKQMEAMATKTKAAEEQVHTKEKQLKNTLDTLGEVLEQNREMQLQNELLNKDNQLKAEQQARLKEQQARLEATVKARRNQIFALGMFLALIVCVLGLIYWQFREKKKANNLLREQKEEIERQKNETEVQRDIANRQTQKITDSIQYARRIQRAVLPPGDSFTSSFKDFFILYKPRDIVSGDFYWMTKKDDILILAVADCTGHGVPGAFMSMLGIAYLNEIVNKIAINKHISTLNADDILNQLREMVISSLHQTGAVEEPKDGMDIALCIIDFEHKKLQFAGANNPLYLVRKGKLIQYDADKMPVSYHQKRNVPFTRHDVHLQPDDRLYLFSDGYVDQFGGDKGLKLLAKKFKELILQVHQRPMPEQEKFLEKAIKDWRGERPQLDDILVIGLRYAAPVSLEGSTAKIDWQSKTILIAEDTDVNYFLMAEVLKATKANLIRVKDGREAVDFIRNNHVDLILMDINMPRLNGYDATREIKQIRQDIPIIVQTAMHLEDESDDAFNAGADDYITKPIDLKTFMSKIERFIS